MVHCWVICLLQLPSPVLLDVHRWCIGLPYCTAAVLVWVLGRARPLLLPLQSQLCCIPVHDAVQSAGTCLLQGLTILPSHAGVPLVG